MRARFLSLSVLFCSFITASQAQYTAQLDPRWGWKANDRIEAIAEDVAGNTVYVGGQFTNWQPQKDIGYGAVVGRSSGMPDLRVKCPNDAVVAAVDDGQGGWFVSGVFAVIGDSTRIGLARIGSDGNATAWHLDFAGVGGSAGVLLRTGDTLIVGGQFTQIGGVARKNLAMVRISTGQLLPFSTTFTGGSNTSVTSMLIAGDTLYVGGTFATAGGSTRTNMCAYRLSTGALTGFDPNVNGITYAMAKGGGSLYIGGLFTTVGGVARSRLAAFNLATGALSASWTPSANGEVDALAWDGSGVMIGGSFTSVTGTGGSSTAYLARRGGTSGEFLPWYLLPDAAVYAITATADTLYLGGGFTALSAGSRNYVASLARSADLGGLYTVRDWDPNCYGLAVHCLALSPGGLYVGGQYQRIGVVQRSHIAAFDRTTGAPTAWNPGANNDVFGVQVGTDKVFVQGSFTRIGADNALRNSLGALNKANNNAAGWDADLATGGASSILLHDNTLYVSGTFAQIGGAARTDFAALDATTALATGLNVALNGGGIARYMVLSNDTLFLGGGVYQVNGTARGRLAAIRASTGELLPFDPVAEGSTFSLTKSGPRIYVTGHFTSFGGQPGTPQDFQSSMYAASAVTGLRDNGWAPPLIAEDLQIIANDHAVYCAGRLTNLGDYGLYGLSPVTGAFNGFYLPAERGMYACTLGADRRLYYSVLSEVNVGGQQYDLRLATESGGPTRLHLRAFLQGPYDSGTGLMNDALRTLPSFPTSEPYSALGYTYVGANGAGPLAPAVLAVTGPNAIVDWVVVELRDANAPATRVLTRVALLQRDGDVVGLDGVSDLAIDNTGPYYVALRHRNHLGAMTAAPVPFNTGTTTVDLTSPATATYGTEACTTIGGVQALWCGDVDFGGTTSYTGASNDRDPILVRIGGLVPTNTVTGYHAEDVNLDDVVKYTGLANDRDPILVNIGGVVPTAVRHAQLP